MKNKITDLRVKIDGLAQMTKSLKPFKWQHVVVEKNIGVSSGIETGIILVGEGSYGPACIQDGVIPYHAIIDTDRGTFRFGSTYGKLDEKRFRWFDYNSKEINKAIDSLLLAKAWLGKALGSMGESTPYANDGNRKTVSDIEPAADVANPTNGMIGGDVDAIKVAGEVLTDENWYGKNHIERVDRLRQLIGEAVKDGEDIYERNANPSTTVPSIIATNIHTHLCEARFWLGFELQRIKEGGPR